MSWREQPRRIAQAPACCVPGCGRPGVRGAGVDLLAVPPRWGTWWCLGHGPEAAVAADKDSLTTGEGGRAPAEGQGRLL